MQFPDCDNAVDSVLKEIEKSQKPIKYPKLNDKVSLYLEKLRNSNKVKKYKNMLNKCIGVEKRLKLSSEIAIKLKEKFPNNFCKHILKAKEDNWKNEVKTIKNKLNIYDIIIVETPVKIRTLFYGPEGIVRKKNSSMISNNIEDFWNNHGIDEYIVYKELYNELCYI